MGKFNEAFNLMIRHEGGYANDPQDPGGETYKGIARNIHGKWKGWAIIDLLKLQPNFPGNLDKDPELQEAVSDFYEVEFWNRISGNLISDQSVVNSIFDFAVNAGVGTSASLAQMVSGSTADGVIGPKSIEAINKTNPDHFLALFTIAKIARYINIVKKRPTSRKYFYGWICRAMGEN